MGCVTLMLALGLRAGVDARPAGPAELYPRLLAAAAWVGTPSQGHATGWLVDADRRWLVTCRHVVGEHDWVEVFFPDRSDGELAVDRQHYLDYRRRFHPERRAFEGRVVRRLDTSDLALVELRQLPRGVKALPLADGLPSPGERVVSLGNRGDVEPLWVFAEGTVRQTGTLVDGYPWQGQTLAKGATVVLAQLPLSGGDSGAPLVNRHGELVGVFSAYQAGAASSLAISPAAVRELLKWPVTSRPTADEEGYLRLARSTAWVRIDSVAQRATGWVVDRERRLLVTSARGIGTHEVVTAMFPRVVNGRVVADVPTYADPSRVRDMGLSARGVVLARDLHRDLALVELECLPDGADALKLADRPAEPGTAVRSVGHPGGLDLLWLNSAGVVRQSGRVNVADSPVISRLVPRVLLVQLPAQGGDSGGAVVNGRDEVVAVLSGREAPQQLVAYAVDARELREFLAETRPLWNPGSAAEWAQRGRHFLRRDVPTARAAFARALVAEPASVEALCGRSEAARRLGDVDAALADAEAAVRADPRAASLCARAAARVARREYKQAIVDASAALEADANCATARLWLGEGRRMLGETDAALAELDEAVWLSPNFAEAYWHRALVKPGGDTDRAIELDPYRPEWLRHRAALRERANDPKHAAADLERVVMLAPADAEAHFGLASLYARSGETARALSAFRRGVSALASRRPGAGEGGHPCRAY
jgi:S1-C subfamily serine protease/tetratricopeptide (TPR) repeat protein